MKEERERLAEKSAPILLATCGTAWAVVLEALEYPLEQEGPFARVHTLTSSSPSLDRGLRQLEEELFRRGIPFTLDRVANFDELRTGQDHCRFEEVLHRWILWRAPNPECRYISLAGGYKTMSAAFQRAAQLFGARQVFHVLCDPIFQDGPRALEARNAAEVEEARARGALHFIGLGEEPGWPALRQVSAEGFPLEAAAEPNRPGTFLHAPNRGLSEWIEGVLQASRGSGPELLARVEELPFPSLALWPPAALAWLKEPLEAESDENWLAGLPKIELHSHLGGFATQPPLLEQVRAAASDKLTEGGAASWPKVPQPPGGWPLPPRPIGLDEYMALGNATGSALLKDPGCLKKQCQLLYEELRSENVVYAEIRCSPANYADPERGRSSWRVLEDIRNAFERKMQEARTIGGLFCHVNLILIATRRKEGDRAPIARNLGLAVAAAEHWTEGCRVVGVDLAGYEDRDTRAAVFEVDFWPVHRVGLAVTVHAGENDDVEGIWQAVYRLHARRLGHALRLGEAPDLMRAVVDRKIGVELCPYANVQIGRKLDGKQGKVEGFKVDGLAHVSRKLCYPVRTYLEHGVLATVNTDNRGISAANLTDNLLLLPRLAPGITRLEVARLLRNAVDVAFTSEEERRRILDAMGRSFLPPRFR